MILDSKTQAELFKSWIESKPYWEKYLWWLHLKNDSVTDGDIEKCYQYLLEDCGAIGKNKKREDLDFPVFAFNESQDSSAKTILRKIENLQNVNAINCDCCINFGNQLTVIYGDNGVGKSGVGRLFSNACFSLKPRKLLPNTRKPIPTEKSEIKANFHLEINGNEETLSYSLGETHKALKCFSVFDHECAPIHLDSENEISFVPSKIRIFDDIFKSILALENLLQKDIEVKYKENPTENLFSVKSKITDFLDSLSSQTSDKDLEKNLNFSEKDQILLDEKKRIVEEKQKQDVTKIKKELKDECSDLNIFKNKLKISNSAISKLKSDEINNLIKEIKEKQEIASKLGLKNFEFDSLKHIGSEEWKALIVAAEIIFKKEKDSNDGKDLDYCV